MRLLGALIVEVLSEEGMQQRSRSERDKGNWEEKPDRPSATIDYISKTVQDLMWQC